MVVNVKGTANFKEKEIKMIPMFLEWFSSKKAPLVYAFCFEECEPLFVYPEKVIYLYEKAQSPMLVTLLGIVRLVRLLHP